MCNVIDPATKEKMLAEPAMVTIHVRADRAIVIGGAGQGGAGGVGSWVV